MYQDNTASATSSIETASATSSIEQLEATNHQLEHELAESKRSVAELGKALAEVSSLLETVPDIICMIDTRGNVVRWNRRLEEITGYDREELRDRHATTFFSRAEQPVVLQGIESAIANGYAEMEVDLLRKDGSAVAYSFVGVPVRDDSGKLIGVTGVGRDVSDRKRTERLSASLKEKEALLKELHHRVKNNLQVISSLLSLQSAYVQDSHALEMFKESQNRVRLMAMIHEALYRSESLSRLDSATFIQDIASNLMRAYYINPESIRVHVDADSAPMGIETAVPCGLIINELLSNALKHAFRNGQSGDVAVELHRKNSHFVLCVSDNGTGLGNIEEWQKPRTLGWQLVKALTDQLGGHVELEGARGTTFRVTFPEQR